MNNEQKHKTTPSIVSIACSTLNTEIITTTSTTTTPTTSIVPQTSVHHHSVPPAAVASSTSSKSSSSLSLAPTLAAVSKSANQASNHVTPMSDASATGQQRGNLANALASSEVAAAKKDVPISAVTDTSTRAPNLAAGGSTPKVASAEETDNFDFVTNADKTKKTETWEECRLRDWDDSRLKNLLEEAYSYKNPRDKENKSETFLQLLQNAENEKEDQTFAFRAIASRYTRNSSTATSSNSQKQGGSLQDLVDAVRNESLDCDYQFSVGGQRNRRHNHNSRQKKYSSVSSRQREGGSLPSNVNVTYSGGNNLLSGVLDQQNAPAFMHEAAVRSNNISINNNNNCTSNINNNNSSKHQQRRNKGNERATVTGEKDSESLNCLNNNHSNSVSTNVADGIGVGVLGGGLLSSAAAHTSFTGDFIIEMGEPMLDIQQSQQILPGKGLDEGLQASPFYEHVESRDVILPRNNVMSSIQGKTEFAPSKAQCYVDETVRFTTLERVGGGGGGGSAATTAKNKVSSSTIDTKYLPLDENYKSCKSVLGEKTEIVRAPSTMFSTTKTITRQFDENGNSFNEIYQKSAAAAAAILNVTSGGSSSVASQSQAKAKNKKKSQQERNTKTVDVKSVAGYRGHDPIEVLVKYIESSEDKQNEKPTSNSNKFNENNKKKDRKKDKEKQHKLKKSNSLEELRSCAKIDVDELKTTAATTESNVIMRNKSAKNKNTSASAADINKNYDNKDLSTTNTKGSATAAASDNNIQRKCERRSWGTEELQYLGDSNCNADKTTSLAKEKKSSKNKDKDKDEKEEKAKDSAVQEKLKEKEKEENNKTQTADTNATTQIVPAATVTHKSEKRKKSEGTMHPTTATITNVHCEDLLDTDASILPEAAEFHIVTKKRKPKKQRPSLDETSNCSSHYTASVGGFNRTSSNFVPNMQKSNNANGAAQRYKYYNQHTTNSDYIHTYNNHANSNHNSYSNYNQRYNNNSHNIKSAGEKTRRLSSSSMPPSEKSDSSDLDSVHSLPIESTTAVATASLIKSKPRHKNTKAATAAATNASAAASNLPAPISYADIARTNQEQQQSASATSANGVDKWPLVDSVGNAISTDNSADDNSVESVASSSGQSVVYATTSTSALITVKHKTKKSATKSDFPELVAILSPPTATATASNMLETMKATNLKHITYSQSLTSVPQAAAIVPSNSGDANVTVVDSLNREKIEKRQVAAVEIRKPDPPTQQPPMLLIQHNCNKPQQVCQQQPLQKSKSVEHDSYNYNSSNIDQQYPALEKTVKRHGTSLVAGAASTVHIFPPAAAKQQQQQQPQQQNINNTNDDFVLAATGTISSTLNKNTSPNAATAATTAAVAVRKPKEKSKDSTEHLSQSSSNAAISIVNNERKTKKDKQQQQQQPQPHQHLLQNELMPYKAATTATQTGATYANNSNISISNVALATTSSSSIKKPQSSHSAYKKKHMKTHSSSKHSTAPAAAGATACTTSAANRPAVIILNDDRSVGGNVPNIEFTFGDFNEDELKFFDDDVTSTMTDGDIAEDYEENEGDSDSNNNNAAVAEYVMENRRETLATHLSAPSVDVAMRDKRKICLNDSGANFNITSASSSSSTSDAGLLNNSVQQADELIMMSTADASSPNSSQLGAGNQSSDSGVYASNKPTKASVNAGRISAINEGVASNNCSRSNYNNTSLPATNSPQTNASNPLSSSSSSTSSSSEQITVTNNGPTSSSPPRVQQIVADPNCNASASAPQQLETCNDIETVIIAAARAAAEHQQQQRPQPICNSSSSASSSFSSCSSVSVESKYSSSYQSHHQRGNHYHYHRPHRHYSGQHQFDEEQLQYQQQAHNHDRSRSNSNHREKITNALHKEKDLYFISPMAPSEMSCLQHNEIIIDFIGSAWEEVANSKVTKFYNEK